VPGMVVVPLATERVTSCTLLPSFSTVSVHLLLEL
jgi:hypothetical protein